MSYIYPLRLKKITGSFTISTVPASGKKVGSKTLSEPHLVISAKVSTTTTDAYVALMGTSEGKIDVLAFNDGASDADVSVDYEAWVLVGA